MKFCKLSKQNLLSLLAKIFVGVVFCYSTSSFAGLLVAPGVKWNSFAFEPIDSEKTYNYYGYGAGLSLGYSVLQALDVSLFGHYIPGKRGNAGIFDPHAVTSSGGGELAVRIYRTVYVGLRGGFQRYSLMNEAYPEEVKGTWTGPCGGGSLGFILEVDKKNFWQLSIDFMQGVLTESGSKTEPPPKRRLDSFGVTLSFVYNDNRVSSIDRSAFSNFINSFSF